MRSSSATSASSDAIIKGSVAFFAPEIGMVPSRRRPPTIRIRSILPPRPKPDEPCRTNHAGPAQELALISASIAAEVGTALLQCGIGRGSFLVAVAAAGQFATLDLRFALFQVFAERRRQPLAPRRPFLRFAELGHKVNSKHTARSAATAARLRSRPPYGKDRRAFFASICRAKGRKACCRSSVVEHSLGKGEVLSSILSGSTMTPARRPAPRTHFTDRPA